MDIIAKLAEELQIKKGQAEAAVKLIDEGNTIPFIARYRKEATGALSDEILRNLFDRLTYLRNLEDKKQTVLASIEEQGKLTEELKAQILAAETQVAEESVVTITVSLGVKPVKVVSVVGASKDAAVATLQGLGLNVTVAQEYSDTVAAGVVINQSVAADTEVQKGSDITITVSQGAKPVKVAKVVGSNKDAAIAVLQTSGLTVSVTEEYSESVAAGIVIRQNVAENTEVQKGSNITIVVSKGPQSTPTGGEADPNTGVTE